MSEKPVPVTLLNLQGPSPKGSRSNLGHDDKVSLGLDFSRKIATEPLSIKKGQMVMVTVEDNGIGISEEGKKQLFQPFKQAQRSAGGTGLGLFSLSKRIGRRFSSLYSVIMYSINTLFHTLSHTSSHFLVSLLTFPHSHLFFHHLSCTIRCHWGDLRGSGPFGREAGLMLFLHLPLSS